MNLNSAGAKHIASVYLEVITQPCALHPQGLYILNAEAETLHQTLTQIPDSRHVAKSSA